MITLSFHVYDSIDSILAEVNDGAESRTVDTIPRFRFQQRTFKSVRDILQYAKEHDEGDYHRDTETSVVFTGPDAAPRPIARKRRIAGQGCEPRDSGLDQDVRTTSAPQRPYNPPVAPVVGSEEGRGYSVGAAVEYLAEHFGSASGADQLRKDKLRRKQLQDRLAHQKREHLNDKIRQRVANREAGIVDNLDDVSGPSVQLENPDIQYASIGILPRAEAIVVCRFSAANWNVICRTIRPHPEPNSTMGALMSACPELYHEEVMMPLDCTRDAKRAIRAKVARVVKASIRESQRSLTALYGFDDSESDNDSGEVQLSKDRKQLIRKLLTEEGHSTVSVRAKFHEVIGMNPEEYKNPEGFLSAIYEYAKEVKKGMQTKG